MKHLKLFDNIDRYKDIISKIEKEFSRERVAQLFDDEWPNWVDDDWERDGFDSDYDWYCEHNNGEAEDIVVDQIVQWAKINLNLKDKEEDKLYQDVKILYQL